jgi:hypothetical protein
LTLCLLLILTGISSSVPIHLYDENNNGDGIIISEGKRRTREDVLVESSDSDDTLESSDGFDRHYVSAAIPQRGNSKKNWEYIGREFKDPDESCNFIIVDVCNAEEEGAKLFFKYRLVTVDVDNVSDSDHEFTPCAELLKADWCQWCNR